MTALYELAHAYKDTAEKLSDLDLPPEVIEDTLESLDLTTNLQEKATNTAMVVRNIEAMAAAIKEAEAQMAARRKALENRAARVREYLLANMQVAGMLKIESPYFRLSVRDNPPAVEVFDAAQVPDSFLRKLVELEVTDACEVTNDSRAETDWITVSGPRECFKFTETPDKAAIKEAIKAKQEVPGCKLTQGKRLEVK